MTELRALKDMPIGFPGLFGDWAWNPDPIAIHIGHGIYWYGIILACAMLCGTYLSMRQAKRCGLSEEHVLDLVLWAAPCCIAASRIYYVVFNLDQYRTEAGVLDWGRAVAVWDGGIAIYGTVLAGILVSWLYARFKKLPFGAMLDTLVPGLMLGQAMGRWANLVNREAFGSVTELPWRMRVWISTTESVDVHPTFLYESLWNFAGLALLLWVVSRYRRFDGMNACFYFLWYGLGRFWIEGLRTDSLYLFGLTAFGAPIRVSQALSLAAVLAAAGVLIWQIVVRKRTAAGLYVNQQAEEAELMASIADTVAGNADSGGAVVMDGKELAAAMKENIRREVAKLSRPPCLAVILVGDDPASQVYVAGKERDCQECGILSRTLRLGADATQDALEDLVESLNEDPMVDGILCQLPLPEHLDASPILRAIDPDKDVDCFHPYNVGLLTMGEPGFLPCTPMGIMALLRRYQVPIRGKRCVVIGRSNIVGKPMATLLSAADGTVTLCHSHTENLPEITREADILISAVGKAGFLTADMVKPGAAVIDVAMNRGPDGKLRGDADYAAVSAVAGWITPVPGGVGPMTRAMLMENLLYAATPEEE